MKAYYNDNSPEAVRWLQWLQLYAAIARGRLDSRSIHDVGPEDLEGVTRAHFFAGIGGWDYALQLAGWPEDRLVWTASLPCQPFSVAGQQKGTEDERHLWPVFRNLVAQCRPAILFGEQVASLAGRSWLASVQIDLEALGYSTAAADLCAAGIGAPHIRQRLYWVAYNETRQWGGIDPVSRGRSEGGGAQGGERSEHGSRAGGVALARGAGLEIHGKQPAWEECAAAERSGESCGLERSDSRGWTPRHETAQASGYGASVESTGGLGNPRGAGSRRVGGGVSEEEGAGCPEWSESWDQSHESLAAGFRVWDDIVFVPCGDGKARPIKPGLEPLVNGVPNRLGRIRGYGNSIVPQVAAVFIRSVMDVLL